MRVTLRLLLTVLWLLPLLVPGASAESTRNNPASTIDVSGHGGISSRTGINAKPSMDRMAGPFEFSVSGGMASDYIYRGTTLSDHKPVVGAAFEAMFGLFYASTTMASVKLPTNPNAEVTFGGGIRPKLGDVELDFGVTYLLYPGETPGEGMSGTDYWEAFARADYSISERVSIAGGYAYSPSISNTGAWSQYVAIGPSFSLPSNLLPSGIAAKLSGSIGHFWFGAQSPALGGFALPAYTNWNAGITFSRKMLNLDLRYSNTNLSKEDCFVFTGDPNATSGGRINPINNPDGMRSNWCGPAFVAKLWFEFN